MSKCIFDNLEKTQNISENDEFIINKKITKHFTDFLDESNWKISQGIFFPNNKTTLVMNHLKNDISQLHYHNACITFTSKGKYHFSYQFSKKKIGAAKLYIDLNGQKQYLNNCMGSISVNIETNDEFCFGLEAFENSTITQVIINKTYFEHYESNCKKIS